mmetsp:Transcript_15834/g.48060  ORF Transcript_15834/g.48060 Transcript_15834/m.48060 type:complete len:230 (-) Transcript_15834:535-1224(-)
MTASTWPVHSPSGASPRGCASGDRLSAPGVASSESEAGGVMGSLTARAGRAPPSCSSSVLTASSQPVPPASATSPCDVIAGASASFASAVFESEGASDTSSRNTLASVPCSPTEPRRPPLACADPSGRFARSGSAVNRPSFAGRVDTPSFGHVAEGAGAYSCSQSHAPSSESNKTCAASVQKPAARAPISGSICSIELLSLFSICLRISSSVALPTHTRRRILDLSIDS